MPGPGRIINRDSLNGKTSRNHPPASPRGEAGGRRPPDEGWRHLGYGMQSIEWYRLKFPTTVGEAISLPTQVG